jgi:hypothetical protein
MHLTSKYLEGKKPADIITLVKEMGRSNTTYDTLTKIDSDAQLERTLDEMKVDLRTSLAKAREVVGTSNVARLSLSSFAGFEQFNELEVGIVDTTYAKYIGPDNGMFFLLMITGVGMKNVPCLAVQLHLIRPSKCTIM